MKIKILVIVVMVLLVGIQFIPRKHANPVVNAVEEFNPERSVGEMALLRSACFDCHSNETEYPWYSYVQPLALWINDHVMEAREELNFSIWQTYSTKKKLDKLEECVEMIESKEMPLTSFTVSHPEARLTDAERLQLTDWLKRQMAEY